MDSVDALHAARAALDAGNWDEAIAGFRELLNAGRDPEALDGLGRALWWKGDGEAAIAARADAYAMFRRAGRAEDAFRIAIWLAHEYAAFGNEAVANGWLARAERLSAGLPSGSEDGWLILARTEGIDDPSAVEVHAGEALRLAREHGDADLEIRALARLGVAIVSSGRVEEGLACFNEAMAAATGGEATTPEVLGETYCDMYRAIGIVGDNGPFHQWTPVINEFLRRTHHISALSFCGSCCGEMMTAGGNIEEAENEMMRAIRELEEKGQRARCVHPTAKLAELRVLQGRYEEAERLLEGYESLPETVRARATLAMVRGEFAVAVALLERRLGSLGADSLLSLPHLVLLVEAMIAKGDLEGAREVAARVESLRAGSDQPRVEAEAARAFARVAAAEGDVARARPAFERALEMFAASGKAIEEARTRLALGRLLAGAEPEIAAAEARAALAAFERLACPREADAAAALLRGLAGDGRSGPKAFGALSRREHDVLQLLSEGLTNAEIAARLFISTKTAGHHVSSILMKTGFKSRGEAAAWAVRAGRES